MPGKNSLFLRFVFETHVRELTCQYSVGALFGALGGVSVWSGLVLPFFLRFVGMLRPTPCFECGQMMLLPLPLLRVAAAAFAALARRREEWRGPCARMDDYALAFVSGWCFLVLFCLCFFVLLCGIVLPEAS